MLGLDYQASPYITSNPDGSHTPVDSLFYLQAPVTSQMADAARVPLHRDIVTRMESLASQDPIVQQVLARSVGANPGDYGDTQDPFTGYGFTAPGPRLPGGQITLNQELKMGGVSVPSGAQIFHQLADGRPVLVATLVQDHAGARRWNVSSDCPPDMRSRFEALADQSAANHAATR